MNGATFAKLGIIAILTLLSPSDRALAQSGLEAEYDRPGQDIKSFDLPAPDPLLCQKACESSTDCRAFTYVKPGVQKAGVARCYLKGGVPAAAKSDCCVSGVKVPQGVVLAFRNGENQTSFPNPNALGINSTRASCCDINGTGWRWYLPKPLGLYSHDLEAWKLPPGLAFQLDHNGRGCSTDLPMSTEWAALDYDKRVVGNYGGRVGCKNVSLYLDVCHGGDHGASEHIGLYWFESTGAGFDDWPHVLMRVPPYATVGLKHSINQRDKKLHWNGLWYDPADLSQPPPPGFVRMHGGDIGAPCDEGYYWYEVNVGQPVWKPKCKLTVAAPEPGQPRTFLHTFWRTAPDSGGNAYYDGTVTAPGNLVSISNPDLGLGKAWTVLYIKPGYTSDDCANPKATIQLPPGQTAKDFQGVSLRGGVYLGFCLTTADKDTLSLGFPSAWSLNITYR